MKRAQSRTTQIRRKRMYDVNPNCPQCGVLMILPETLPKNHNGNIKYFPPNTCTYEHSRSRLDPLRKKDEPFRNKILCLKCNGENGQKDVDKFLTINEKRERAKRHPQQHPL